MLTITLRKALVIPTALTLALGGALLAAGPASAAPTTLTVTSSTPTPSTFTVDYKGTTTPGVDVQLIDPADPTSPYDEETADLSTGAWELTTTFDNTFDTHQQLQIVSDPTGASETQNESVTLPSIAITSPTPNSGVVAGKPFQVTGTAPIGSSLTVVAASQPFAATVDSTGHFTSTVTEPRAVASDTIQVQGVTSDGEDLNDPTVSVAVAAAPSTLKVLTPSNGFTSTRRSVDFTGTGTAGDSIHFSVNGVDAGSFPVNPDNTWSETLYFTDPSAPNAESVLITQPADNGSVTVNLSIAPAPVVLAPVIVKPAGGSTSGFQVTFSGTSQPGTFVSLYVIPTALYAVGNGTATPAQTAAAAALDPTAIYEPTPFVKVDAQGNWTVTKTLTAGDWTAIGLDAANADGSAPTENSFLDNSALGASREFLVSASATTTAATGTTPVVAAAAKPATLAFTGSNDGPLYGVAGFLLLAGAGLVVVARRRRALQD